MFPGPGLQSVLDFCGVKPMQIVLAHVHEVLV